MANQSFSASITYPLVTYISEAMFFKALTPKLKQPNHNRDTGVHFEREAERFLKKHGLKTVATNYHHPLGEIDIIMKDKNTLVFVEVRYRKNSRHGSALETITKQKQAKLSKAALSYLQKNPWTKDFTLRFDVVGIDNSASNEVNFSWVQGAFFV